LPEKEGEKVYFYSSTPYGKSPDHILKIQEGSQRTLPCGFPSPSIHPNLGRETVRQTETTRNG
jgi:hypothetical protein